LTAFQTKFDAKRPARSSAWPVVTVLCLVLLALLAVVQVAHFHSDAAQADHCTLCISMHTAAPIAVTAAAIVLVQLGISAPVFEAQTIVRHRYSKLYTRPPPTGC